MRILLPRSMPQQLIINADDLGLCPSVNTAIFDVFRAGNLTSATLMVHMPGTDDAVRRLKDHPGLGIGLHFCITEGRSHVGPSTLTDAQGAFRSRRELVRAALRGKIDPNDVQRELEEQLSCFKSFGVTPTHADSHQHIHMVPVVMDAMLPILQRESLAMRVVDPPTRMVWGSLGRPRKTVKQFLSRSLARRARKRVRVRTNDVLVSIHDLDDAGPYNAATYAGLLRGMDSDAVVELVVHPYILGEDVKQLYGAGIVARQPFLDRCVAEYEALRHGPVFGDAQLITFAAIRP